VGVGVAVGVVVARVAAGMSDEVGDGIGVVGWGVRGMTFQARMPRRATGRAAARGNFMRWRRAIPACRD
jgi:hypothetical protein